MPRLKRVSTRQAEVKRKRRARAALKPRTVLSDAAKTLADKKWDKNNPTRKQYLADLAKARQAKVTSTKKGHSAKNAAKAAQLADRTAKKKAYQDKQLAIADQAEKDDQEIRRLAKIRKKKKEKNKNQPKKVVASTTLFEEAPRRSTRKKKTKK